MTIMHLKRSAFTLVELLVVVALIGILATIVISTYRGNSFAAGASITKKNHQQIVHLLKTVLTQCDVMDKTKLCLKLLSMAIGHWSIIHIPRSNGILLE